jgi:hypothetical protein
LRGNGVVVFKKDGIFPLKTCVNTIWPPSPLERRGGAGTRRTNQVTGSGVILARMF